MYKFEISADSPTELREKMLDFAKEMAMTPPPAIPEYANEPIDEDIPEVPKAPEFPLFNVPPAPSGPVVESAPPVFATSQSNKDGKGFPYDERIHSAAKSLNKDGTWRLKRGVSDDMVRQVEDEFYSKNPRPSAMTPMVETPVVIPPPPAPTVHVETPVFQPQAAPVAPVVVPVTMPTVVANPHVVQPAPAQYENIQIPQGTRPAHSYATFKANFTMVLAQLVNDGKITQEYIKSLKDHFGVKEVWNILASEKQCIEVFETFGKHGLITVIEG